MGEEGSTYFFSHFSYHLKCLKEKNAKISMNQSTSFHIHTISTLFRMEFISRVSYDIECRLLTCQAVDFVIKTTFLPGKLSGQLTTHSSSLNLRSLTHMIATANWLHKCCILYTECSMCLSHSTTKDILNSTLYKKQKTTLIP